MGSQGEDAHPLQGQREEITVLVTGFGPFRAQYPINPSWSIASSLPPFLPPSPTSSLPSNTILSSLPPVRILVHPSPVRVAYSTVRTLVPQLWKNEKIDYCIHIGMASGRRYYSIERRGHRDGYLMRDVDNELLNDDETHRKEGKDWVWDGLPSELLTDIDVDDVWKRWRVALPATDLRISEDAGHYLCDFIYYSSLAHLTKNAAGKPLNVLFLHVPVDASDTAIHTGIQAMIELIRGIVVSGEMKRLTNLRVQSAELGREEKDGEVKSVDFTA